MSASSDRYEAGDHRFRQQVGRLLEELRREGGSVRVKSASVAGAKGGPETIILALGSSGAFTFAVNVIREWLRRDRSRSLHVAWTRDGVRRQLTLKADAMDSDTFKELSKLALKL
jgi:membrane-associated two-gene conflict system component 1 (EACC1)